MLYRKSTNLKQEFTANVLSLFTSEVGGHPTDLADILFSRYVIDDFAYHDDWYHHGVIEYFRKTVIPHKIEVYMAGVELSRKDWFTVYLSNDDQELFMDNLWLHDLSKFSANEAFGYAMHDFKKPNGPGKEGFE